MPGAQDLRPVYLVTGCAGFIGSHLSERLVRDENLVVGVDCLTDHYSRTGEGADRRAFSLHPGHLGVRAGYVFHIRSQGEEQGKSLV